ncbi:MAG: delta-60 repeat domain-containing protein [Flavobacteriales bacterium]|nr:delta-60 repeat domain-containing protein [Flavobacteriales bacterium]
MNSTAIQFDEKIIIGGNFTRYNDNVRNSIARINPNGVLCSLYNLQRGEHGSIHPPTLAPGAANHSRNSEAVGQALVAAAVVWTRFHPGVREQRR